LLLGVAAGTTRAGGYNLQFDVGGAGYAAGCSL
jgi:hypothetical protein